MKNAYLGHRNSWLSWVSWGTEFQPKRHNPNHPSPEFLGTARFCRLWILGFATLAAPLYPLTKEKGEFIWTEDHSVSF